MKTIFELYILHSTNPAWEVFKRIVGCRKLDLGWVTKYCAWMGLMDPYL